MMFSCSKYSCPSGSICYDNGNGPDCEVKEDCLASAQDRGYSYKGDLDQTLGGKTCQDWASQSPHQHTTPSDYPEIDLTMNYCRNPNNETKPWCYTTDPSVEWQYCDVPVCLTCSAATMKYRRKLYQFGEAHVGSTSYSEKTCKGKNKPKAAISCVLMNGIAVFDKNTMMRRACKTAKQARKDLAEAKIKTSSLILETVQDLSIISSDDDNGTTINETVQAISYVSGLNNTDVHANVTVQEDYLSSMAMVVSNVMQSTSKHSKHALRRERKLLRKAWRNAAKKVKLQKKQTDMVINTPNLNFRVEKPEVTPKKGGQSGYDFTNVHYNSRINSIVNASIARERSKRQIPTAELETDHIVVTVGSDALEDVFNQLNMTMQLSPNDIVVTFSLYRGSALYPSDYPSNEIVAISAVPEFDGNLTHPINIVYKWQLPPPVQQNAEETIYTHLHCAMWNDDDDFWMLDACSLVGGSSPPQCNCREFGVFTLVEITTKTYPDLQLPPEFYVGGIFMAALLMLTCAVYILFPYFRKRETTPVLLCIFGCLIVMVIVFLIGVGGVNQSYCNAITALLQFFYLSAWCWMVVFLYQLHSIWLKKTYICLEWVSIVFAVGVPLFIVLIDSLVTVYYISPSNFNQYSTMYHMGEACWVQGNSLYFGLFFPVALMAAFAILTTFTLICRRPPERVTVSKKKFLDQQEVLAAFLIVLVVFTWLMAYLFLISERAINKNTTSALFLILSFIMGSGVFYICCLWSRRVRDGWIPFCFPCAKKEPKRDDRVPVNPIVVEPSPENEGMNE